MGLLDNQTHQDYYNGSDFGNYQFVTLDSIINAFSTIYIGEGKILTKVNRTDIQFFAMRAMQELSYDVFRSIKAQEIQVPNTLKISLPHDYVNYVKLVKVGNSGVEENIYPTGKTSNPFSVSQNANGDYLYDSDGSLTDGGDSDLLSSFNNQESNTNSSDGDDVQVDYRGRRYGLDPQFAHQHGSFFIDNQRGFIHFSSDLSGSGIILKYISDGLGTDEEMVVHKFCEEAVYKWIAYGLLGCRTGIPDGVLMRFRAEKIAETRKAKIRLSNIKMEEFTQILKGMSKQIK